MNYRTSRKPTRQLDRLQFEPGLNNTGKVVWQATKQAKKSSKTSKKNNDEVHHIYLNVKQRAEVLELIKKKVSSREISAMFNIAPGTITNIKKQKDKIEEHQNLPPNTPAGT